jgi:hypothetical protein
VPQRHLDVLPSQSAITRTDDLTAMTWDLDDQKWV